MVFRVFMADVAAEAVVRSTKQYEGLRAVKGSMDMSMFELRAMLDI